MDPFNDASVLIDPVEILVHFVHACLGYGLQAYEQLFAAAPRGPHQEFWIATGLNTYLAAPPFPVRCNFPEESFRIVSVARQIVVPENDHLPPERSKLRCSRTHGTLADIAVVHGGKRAEITSMRTSPRSKESSGRIVAPVVQVFPGHRDVLQCRGLN